MNFEEEEARLERKYQSLLKDKSLSAKQKKDIKALRRKLSGSIYDPSFLFDWVREIPFDGVWDEPDGEVILRVVGVVLGFHDFYYIGYNQDGDLHMMLCNCPDHEALCGREVSFPEYSNKDIKEKIEKSLYEDDKLLIFRTSKKDKELIVS
jgi:hypothetical protein